MFNSNKKDILELKQQIQVLRNKINSLEMERDSMLDKIKQFSRFILKHDAKYKIGDIVEYKWNSFRDYINGTISTKKGTVVDYYRGIDNIIYRIGDADTDRESHCSEKNIIGKYKHKKKKKTTKKRNKR